MIDRRYAAAIVAPSLLALVATIVAPPLPRLVWNASASAPVGLYHVRPGAAVRDGDMVVARLAPAFADLAARRHYLPRGVPLVKRVAAVERDIVCAEASRIWINGRWAADRARRDGRGRPMPWWRGCRVLAEGELLLLMDEHAGSFDGRYVGVTGRADVVGRAVLIWPR